MSDVEIGFGGEFDELHDQLDEIGREIRDTFGAASIAAAATFTTAALQGFELLTEGIRGGIELLREFIAFSAEGEQVNIRLALAARGAGEEFKFTVDQLNEMADSLQNVSTQSSGTIKAAEQILIRFNLVGEQFKRTLELSADLSAAIGTDMTSAASMLGRALQNPEQGMNFLRRAGVALNDQERELIKTLSDSGDKLRAQEILLQSLERRLQGSSEIMRGTYLGGWQALGQIWDDIREEIGSGLLSLIDDLARSLGGLDSQITDGAASTADILAELKPKVKDFFASLKEDILSVSIAFVVLTERAMQGPQLIMDAWTTLDVSIKRMTGTSMTKDEMLAGIRAGGRLADAQRGDKESITEEVARRIMEASRGSSSGGGGLPDVESGSLPINWDRRVAFAGMMPFGSIDTRMASQLASTGGLAGLASSFGGIMGALGGVGTMAGNALGSAGRIGGNLFDDKSTFKAQFEDANSLFKRIQSSAASIDDDPQKKTAKATETTASNTQKLVDFNASIETNMAKVATALGRGIATVLE